MNWQEYQDAVGEFYLRLKQMGNVKKNIFLTDKTTGHKRQIDVWWELDIEGHQINILIDAKLRSVPVDVKDVEEIASLANSVTAHKAIIVTNNGWTEAAIKKAEFNGMEIKIFSIEEALNLVVPNKWFMCYDCIDECVVLDWDGVIYLERKSLFFDWQAGRCRNCKNLYIHCPACGGRSIIEDNDPWECGCGNKWKTTNEQLFVKFENRRSYLRIDNAVKVGVEFIFWLLRYPEKYWGKELLGKVYSLGTDGGNQYTFQITDDGYESLALTPHT